MPKRYINEEWCINRCKQRRFIYIIYEQIKVTRSTLDTIHMMNQILDSAYGVGLLSKFKTICVCMFELTTLHD